MLRRHTAFNVWTASGTARLGQVEDSGASWVRCALPRQGRLGHSISRIGLLHFLFERKAGVFRSQSHRDCCPPGSRSASPAPAAAAIVTGSSVKAPTSGLRLRLENCRGHLNDFAGSDGRVFCRDSSAGSDFSAACSAKVTEAATFRRRIRRAGRLAFRGYFRISTRLKRLMRFVSSSAACSQGFFLELERLQQPAQRFLRG